MKSGEEIKTRRARYEHASLDIWIGRSSRLEERKDGKEEHEA